MRRRWETIATGDLHMQRFVLTLQLRPDSVLAEEYVARHREVWPEVLDSLRDSGILVGLDRCGELRRRHCGVRDCLLHLREGLLPEDGGIELIGALRGSRLLDRDHAGTQHDAEEHQGEHPDPDQAAACGPPAVLPHRGGRHSSARTSESPGRICSLRPVPARNVSSACGTLRS